MEILPRWRGVQSFMGGLQGADNGDVTHYDDKKRKEDDAGYQDGERNRGRVGGGEEGACSWEETVFCQLQALLQDLLEFSSHPARPQILVAIGKNIIMWIQMGYTWF